MNYDSQYIKSMMDQGEGLGPSDRPDQQRKLDPQWLLAYQLALFNEREALKAQQSLAELFDGPVMPAMPVRRGCVWCEQGYKAVPSSVADDAWVHPETPAGRRICSTIRKHPEPEPPLMSTREHGNGDPVPGMPSVSARPPGGPVHYEPVDAPGLPDGLELNNKYLVGVQGDEIVVMASGRAAAMSYQDAMVFAAHLVALAEPHAGFKFEALRRVVEHA